MNSDYEEYDLLIGMDRANLRDMYRICGGDFMDKMRLLLDYTDRPGQEVADLGTPTTSKLHGGMCLMGAGLLDH